MHQHFTIPLLDSVFLASQQQEEPVMRIRAGESCTRRMVDPSHTVVAGIAKECQLEN